MRNLKKFLALVLAMMMVMSLMLTVNAAKTPAEFGDSDKITDTYAEAVNVLSALGIIKGDAGGSDFRPTDPITRAEVAAMLYRIAANDADEEQVKIYSDYDKFPDVPSDKWYAGAVNYCANSEYIKGYSDGTFGAWRNITGYEVLAMTLRVLGYGQNGEFEGTGWMIQTARYGRLAGLTQQIKEGTLGAPATREVVAEIMFQALQADIVDYNLLERYHPVLLVDASEVGAGDVYDHDVADTLMYRNWKIVGKRTILGSDGRFGRPVQEWVKDNAKDTVINGGKYIVNPQANVAIADITSPAAGAEKTLADKIYSADTPEAARTVAKGAVYVPKTTPGATYAATAKNAPLQVSPDNKEDAVVAVALTPLVTYTDGVTECQVSKDINNDETIDWDDITEYLNGTEVTHVIPKGAHALSSADYTTATSAAGNVRPESFDALHTTTDFIGATGRTTEIYGLDDGTYIFVYIDTLLGEVTSTTPELKDANGHVIREATAKVHIGVGTEGGTAKVLKELTLANPSGKFTTGDLVLVQTAKGQATALEKVDNPDTAPLSPRDVPDEDTDFAWESNPKAPAYLKNPALLSVGAEKVRVTVTATEGAANLKMGIRADNGKTYWASNVFLAARNTADNSARATSSTANANATTLAKWYDVPNKNYGISNNMIGKTYDIVLDQNGYIVGMDLVASTAKSNVGIITAIDTEKLGLGKYVPVVKAFMADGTEGEFQLLGVTDATAITNYKSADWTTDDHKKANGPENLDKTKLTTYDSITDAEGAWKGTGIYGDINVGSLVMFEEYTTKSGVTAWYICDYSLGTVDSGTTSELFGGASSVVKGYADGDNKVLTGVAYSLGEDVDDYTAEPNAKAAVATKRNVLLDSKSTIFLAEGEYRYNTGDVNEGSLVDIDYSVYEGFKKMPTITGKGSNILFQQLRNHPSYVFIYAAESKKEFNVLDKSTIAVDDSCLVLSRGATFAEYSEYNVLKNGKQDVLKVSNTNNAAGNQGLNEIIEQAMAGKLLIKVTNTNKNGYVTGVATLNSLIGGDNQTDANTANVVTAPAGAYEEKGGLASSTLLPVWNVDNATTDWDFSSKATKEYWKVSESNDVLSIRNVEADTTNKANDAVTNDTADEIMYMTLAEGCQIQLVNLDLKSVREIGLAEALDYINGVSPAGSRSDAAKWTGHKLTPHDFTYELDANGYVCNIYVIENTPVGTPIT